MTVPPDWALAIPTPGIHNPPGGGGPLPTPIPLQQLGATMQFFIDVFVGKIAIAFGGIEILGWHPFQFLADWGQARIDQANANYLLAATADGKAQDALDFIASMVDGILGTGHTVGDFVDWLQDTSANATTSISQWNSVISGLAVGDFSGLLAFFEGIPTDIAAAAADGAAALDKLVHVSVAGIYDAAAGFSNLATSLLKNLTPTGGNIGQFDASGLTGAFNGAVTLGGNSFTNLLQYLNSSGQFAAGQLTGAINGSLTLGGVTLSTLVTNINSSGQILAAGITGALGTGLTVGGVTLSTLFTNISGTGGLIASGITGALSSGLTVGGVTLGTLFTNINSTGQIIAGGITGALGTGLTVGGVTLGTLFTNINSSGQLLLSGATGALNTAVTIGAQTIGTLATNWNAAVADVNSLITGIGGSVIGDVTNYLQNVPNTAVQGLVGFGTNIGNSITALSDGVWQGLRAFLGIPSGVGPPQVSSAAQQVRVDLNNATDIASASAAFQAKQSISKQSYLSIDPSADPVFPLAQINGASPSTVSVTQTKSVMGIIGLPDNGLKKSLVWLGGSLANITGVYVNLYKVNTTTGVFTRTHQSSNIIGDLTSPVSGVAWQFYNLPMTAFFPTLQGEWYVAEIVVVGSGTYSIVGISNSWMPSHPSVYPKALGAARTGLPSTLYSAIGAAASGSNTTTVNETITLNSGDNAVYVAVILFSNTSALTSVSATLGGVAMTLKSLSTDFLSSSAFEYLAVFELIGTAGSGAFTTGSKTIAVTEAGLTGTFGMAVRAASFKNVASSGAAQTATGTNASPAQTVTGLTKDQLVFQAFAAASAAAGQSMSGYNQEQIANIASATGVSDCLLLGDAFAGVSTSVAFSATAPASGWRGIAVPITLSASPFAPPSSISSPTYDAATPWLALAGAAGRAQHPPETVEFETAGTFTYNVPSWVEDGDYIDIVPIGAGAGGSYCGNTAGVDADSLGYTGGGAGHWNPIRLRYGDAYDIPTGTTSFTVNIGAGGSGGLATHPAHTLAHGSNGGNTTVVVPGHPTITANGGTADGSTVTFGYGDTPGNTVFQGVNYFGGAALSAAILVGNSPGGGGSYGYSWHGTLNPGDYNGGTGAPGACYVTAIQNS